MTTNEVIPAVADADGYPLEYSVCVPRMHVGTSEPVVVIGVSKLGGGTPGESYAGTWEYVITSDGITVISGGDLRSGTPATHETIARVVCDYLSVAGESLYLRGDRSDYLGEYGDEAQSFLISEYDRLSMFGEGIS